VHPLAITSGASQQQLVSYQAIPSEFTSQRMSQSERRAKKQRRITLGVLCTASVDLLLVVMPNCLQLMITLDIVPYGLSRYFTDCAAVAAILRCCVNLPIQLVFNVDFRAACKKYAYFTYHRVDMGGVHNLES